MVADLRASIPDLKLKAVVQGSRLSLACAASYCGSPTMSSEAGRGIVTTNRKLAREQEHAG